MIKEELINYYKNYLELIKQEINIDEHNGRYCASKYQQKRIFSEFIEQLKELEIE